VKVVEGKPPNYAEIVHTFGPLPAGACFTWGDILYTAKGAFIDPGLELHEETHRAQQARAGGPERWWARYLADPDFRREQEVEAYRKQAALYRVSLPRKMRRPILNRIAKDLASSLYGRIVTKAEAREIVGV